MVYFIEKSLRIYRIYQRIADDGGNIFIFTDFILYQVKKQLVI